MARKRNPWDGLDIPSDRREWELLSGLIGLVTLTGRIEGERPESLLIVGPSGAGKSALLDRYHFPAGDARNPHIMRLTNLSAWGLSGALLDDVPRGATHIIVPEMQTLMLRQRGVWDNLVGLLLPAMEEGVHDIRVGPKTTSFNGARIGLIGAITDGAFNDNRGALRESGLLSRMLVVQWRRDRENILASQLRANAGDLTELTKIHVDLKGKVSVNITRAAADAATRFAHEVEPVNPFRGARRVKALAKAVAYLAGEETATEQHVEALRAFLGFWKA